MPRRDHAAGGVCVGIALIYFGIAGRSGKPSESITLAQDLIACAGGLFLLAGLWTPIMGTAVALDEVWIGLSLHAPRREDTWIHIFQGVLSVSLAMLGIDRTTGRRTF